MIPTRFGIGRLHHYRHTFNFGSLQVLTAAAATVRTVKVFWAAALAAFVVNILLLFAPNNGIAWQGVRH